MEAPRAPPTCEHIYALLSHGRSSPLCLAAVPAPGAQTAGNGQIHSARGISHLHVDPRGVSAWTRSRKRRRVHQADAGLPLSCRCAPPPSPSCDRCSASCCCSEEETNSRQADQLARVCSTLYTYNAHLWVQRTTLCTCAGPRAQYSGSVPK